VRWHVRPVFGTEPTITVGNDSNDVHVHKITCFRDYCNCKDSFWRVCIFSSYRIPFIDIRTRLSEGLNLVQISPFPELINFNILRVLRVLNVSRVLKVVASDIRQDFGFPSG